MTQYIINAKTKQGFNYWLSFPFEGYMEMNIAKISMEGLLDNARKFKVKKWASDAVTILSSHRRFKDIVLTVQDETGKAV